MKRKSFALAALGVAFAFNTNAKADDADDNHTVAISIPEVAILDPEGSTSVSLSVEAPTEAGEAHKGDRFNYSVRLLTND